MLTAENLASLINSQLEDNTIPKAIMEVLKKHDGKKLTKRHEKELREAVSPEIRIVKRYGWTEIDWNGELNNLRVSFVDRNVVIDCDQIYKDNIRFFDALEERNQKRLENLQDAKLLEETAACITQYNELCKKVNNLIKKFQDNYRVKDLLVQE